MSYIPKISTPWPMVEVMRTSPSGQSQVVNSGLLSFGPIMGPSFGSLYCRIEARAMIVPWTALPHRVKTNDDNSRKVLAEVPRPM